MLGSALAFLVIFELLLRGSLPYLSLRYHKYLHGEIFMLAQHAKRALLPHDYLTIFGGSYAEVVGDWYEDTVCQDCGTACPIRRRM